MCLVVVSPINETFVFGSFPISTSVLMDQIVSPQGYSNEEAG